MNLSWDRRHTLSLDSIAHRFDAWTLLGPGVKPSWLSDQARIQGDVRSVVDDRICMPSKEPYMDLRHSGNSTAKQLLFMLAIS